jgi:hypothetical protein
MVPFGLTTAGILEFEAEDGIAQIKHIDGKYGPLGQCCIIGGPDGPKETDEMEGSPQATGDQSTAPAG